MLCVEKPKWPSPKDRYLTQERIEECLRQRAGATFHTERITTYLIYPGVFPVDVRHNSKIFREKLAVWADKQLGPQWNPEANETKANA